MSIRTTILSLAGFVLLAAGSGCEISHCERGAVCSDFNEDDEAAAGERDPRALCTAYCDRLDVCGGPQAEDFDDCVDACEKRFERTPERTRELCECAEWSRCADVVEGRCTDPAPGSGGTSSHGGPSAGSPGAGASAPSGGSSARAGSGSGASTATDPGTGGTGEPPTCSGESPGTATAGAGGDGAAGESSCSCPVP